MKSVLFSTHTGRGCVTWQQLKVMCLQESILDLYLKSVLISTHTGRVCVPKQQPSNVCYKNLFIDLYHYEVTHYMKSVLILHISE